jgi:hypothetical protein
MGIRKMLEILVIFGGDKGVKANSSDYKTSTKVLAFIYRSGATISL